MLKHLSYLRRQSTLDLAREAKIHHLRVLRVKFGMALFRLIPEGRRRVDRRTKEARWFYYMYGPCNLESTCYPVASLPEPRYLRSLETASSTSAMIPPLSGS